MKYNIIHFRAGALKGQIEATSEREALATRFGVEPSTREDGRPVVRYGMPGTTPPVIIHEYVAQAVA